MPSAGPKRLPGLPATLLYVCFVLEVWLFTWGRGAFGLVASPLVFTAAGIVIALLGMVLLPRLGRRGGQPLSLAARILIGLCLLAGLVYLSFLLADVFEQLQVRIHYSDIIPSIRVYVRRWLWGSVVYRPLTQEIGYLMMPAYPPATWFPFTLAEYFSFDYRWVAAAVLLLGFVAYWAWLAALRAPAVETFVKALLPLVLTLATLRTEPAMFGYTVEPMILGYYLLLGAALLTRFQVLKAIALTLCLLSRFSLVVWTPLLFLIVWWHEGWRRAVGLGLITGGLLTAFYLWPVVRHDPDLQKQILLNYDNAAINEWKSLNEAGVPRHLFNGLGMARFFYPKAPTTETIVLAIKQLKRVHLLLISLVTLVCAVGWWFRRRQWPNRNTSRFFALLSLKLYLVFFYAFLQVPYAYVTSLSVFFSLLIVLLVPAPWSSDQLAGASQDS